MLPLIGSLLEVGMHVLDKVIPDPAQKAQAQLELLKLQQAGDFKQLEADLAAATGQMEINKVEAASSSLLVSGARPAAMWVCNLGLLYQFVVMPLGSFAYIVITGHALPVAPPVLDDNLWQLLAGVLGLAGWRSFDKKNGVAAK